MPKCSETACCLSLLVVLIELHIDATDCAEIVSHLYQLITPGIVNAKLGKYYLETRMLLDLAQDGLWKDGTHSCTKYGGSYLPICGLLCVVEATFNIAQEKTTPAFEVYREILSALQPFKILFCCVQFSVPVEMIELCKIAWGHSAQLYQVLLSLLILTCTTVKQCPV